jgi:glycine cleavage system H protein
VSGGAGGASGEGAHVGYKRSRFATRLPSGRLYTPSHAWLAEVEPGCWRVGLTTFATRMLGEIVEFDFEVRAGATVQVADVIGWIEGFKAVSDIYCVVRGEYLGPNAEARARPGLTSSRPFDEGWLYSVRGAPDPAAVDVAGYVAHLDRTIDRMLAGPVTASEELGPR